MPAAAPAPRLRWASPDLGETRAAWLAEACELFERCMLHSEGLPAPALYCAMIDGRWAEHGWSRR